MRFGGQSGEGILWILLFALWLIMLAGVFSTAGWILNKQFRNYQEGLFVGAYLDYLSG